MRFKPSVAIIGCGFGGLAAAVKLQKKGIDNFVIFERSPKPGGTWYDNSYPGCGVDVHSRLYSFSFMHYDWSRTHCGAAELQQYAEDLVDQFSLRDRILFSTSVAEIRWDRTKRTYEVRTSDGTTREFNVVISAVGFLNNPNYPDWPGLSQFEGVTFHTQKWNHNHDCNGKTIALVGTGSTSIQIAPELARVADHLYIFQREPGWIMPKFSRPYKDRTRALYRRSRTLDRLSRLVWFLAYDVFARGAFSTGSRVNRLANRLGHVYIKHAVKDPELREKVTPLYPFGCKRPLWSDDFYATLAEPNVTLVAQAVESVTADAVVAADGQKYPIDTLILATGFKPQQYLASITVRGVEGRTLDEIWEGSPKAFLGLTVAGFPNFFIMYGPNTNGGNAITFQLERQAEAVARVVHRMARDDNPIVDTSDQAFDRYVAWIDSQNAKRFNVVTLCNNYYRAPDGRNVTQWPRGGLDYWLLCRALPERVLFDSAKTTSNSPTPETLSTREPS
jgi:cation diffusion facilitator CzcD-associated flavoprotein CzcO